MTYLNPCALQTSELKEELARAGSATTEEVSALKAAYKEKKHALAHADQLLTQARGEISQLTAKVIHVCGQCECVFLVSGTHCSLNSTLKTSSAQGHNSRDKLTNCHRRFDGTIIRYSLVMP